MNWNEIPNLLLAVLVFPGIAFTFAMSVLLAGIDRILVARMQRRVGPPLLQPLYDYLKCLGKETIVPRKANRFWFFNAPLLGLVSVFVTALLIPVVIAVGWFSIGISGHLENWLFDGNMRLWLTNELGIPFDQRNALVVGLAMGFAVIPNIYSIAEDAVFSVPKSLTFGSLALGATPWQTLTRVVILTASPGIFSALMIGLGRAVGETMIVLMATGNTPIMDWNIFNGMRTLSANIATELPEAAQDSTHYRVLFLGGLILFSMTFILNTLAEIVRQRLRKRFNVV